MLRFIYLPPAFDYCDVLVSVLQFERTLAALHCVTATSGHVTEGSNNGCLCISDFTIQTCSSASSCSSRPPPKRKTHRRQHCYTSTIHSIVALFYDQHAVIGCQGGIGSSELISRRSAASSHPVCAGLTVVPALHVTAYTNTFIRVQGKRSSWCIAYMQERLVWPQQSRNGPPDGELTRHHTQLAVPWQWSGH